MLWSMEKSFLINQSKMILKHKITFEKLQGISKMLLGTLGASLLENLLISKGTIRAGQDL